MKIENVEEANQLLDERKNIVDCLNCMKNYGEVAIISDATSFYFKKEATKHVISGLSQRLTVIDELLERM